MFFQKANYLTPEKYEEHFDSSNEIVNRENETIKDILTHFIPPDMEITDIGCGTGLGRKLLPNQQYIGVDSSQNSIDYCKEQYEGIFYCEDAESYINTVDRINPIFLFSLDYLTLETIEKYIKKTDNILIAFHCNKPFLSKTSVYSDKEETYYKLHPKEEIESRLALFETYEAQTFNLLNEEFYYVSIIHRG